MALFDQHLEEVNAYLERKRSEGNVTAFARQVKTDWPVSKTGNLVLSQDAAVELGNPSQGSTSFLLWKNASSSNNKKQESKNQITIVGPDLPELEGQSVPFGKIVIVEGVGFDEENSYDRYRQLDLLRYDIHLKGYMMRGASQFQREWSRVSKDVISKGFSFKNLGSALIDKFMELSYVRSVEVVFITAGQKDIMEMGAVSNKVYRIISAMNKMAEELSCDCGSCDYSDVCSEVEELRTMRHSEKKEGAAKHA
jgi:CO dehydrogenase/acetyl-CoA synthase beta subunit